MTTYQQKAEQYVREQLPELMELSFGCELKVKINDDETYNTRIQDIENGNEEWGIVVECNDYLVETLIAVIGTDEQFFQIIGHPIQLQHWVSVLPELEKLSVSEIDTLVAYGVEYQIHFDMTTGQPATEADYQAFCNIVGV